MALIRPLEYGGNALAATDARVTSAKRPPARASSYTALNGLGNGDVGKTALVIASAKSALPVAQMFFLAVLCNVLVCLAVWMSFGARSMSDKIMVVVPPIAAFVVAGFEHSTANIYFLPHALAIKTWAGSEFWAALGQSPDSYSALTLAGAIRNIGVTTIGNLVSGSLMVGAIY